MDDPMRRWGEDEDLELEEPFDDSCFDHFSDHPPAKRPKEVKESTSILKEPFIEEDIPIPDPFVPESDSSNCVETHQDEEYYDPPSVESSETSGSEFSDHIVMDEPFLGSNDFVSDDIDLLADINDYNEKLYSSSKLTVVKSLALLFSWFCSSPGSSKESFSRLLSLLNEFILPEGNVLPSSYSKALVAIKHFIVPVQKYDCCINDCIIFRKCSDGGDFSKMSECPNCKQPRYQGDSKIARKVFKYIPLAPRLNRMFKNDKISGDLQSHQSSNSSSATISDIHQSPAWKYRYNLAGPFKGDPRGISLGFCADGMNPFSKEKVTYSMWPIVLTILNLPREVRNSPGSMLLVGIIPGRAEPKCIDPYLDILVDEIMQVNGSQFYDGCRKEYFKLKIDILLHVLDYPGHNKVFHCQGAGAYAGCAYCTQTGERSQILQKVIYPGSRRFLPNEDPLRDDSNNFPDKAQDKSASPDIKTTKYVDEANDAYTRASQQEKCSLAQQSGCKGSYSFRKLPLHERILNTPVDPMHLVKNIIEHCVRFITGNEDSYKVRREEKSRNRFRSSWIVDDTDKLPPAPFALSRDEISLADERAKSIIVHASFDWRPRAFFSKKAGMKAHEWKEVTTNGILKFCLRGMLGRNQRQTLYKLFDVIRDVCAEDVNIDMTNNLEKAVHHALALFERDFPVSLQVIVFHLLHHLPMFVKRFGPVYSFWMYPYERFNSWISRRVLNRRYPESTVVETYRLSEWANFLEVSNHLAEGATGMLLANSLPDEESEGLLNVNTEIDTTEEEYTLTDEQHKLLNLHYVNAVSDYKQFVEQYEMERERAKVSHHLRNFPSFSEWQPQYSLSLTKNQSHMRKGPSPLVTRMKRTTYQDSHGRKVRLSTVESERDYWNHQCSFISAQVGGVLKFGRILTIFGHTFLSTATVFAYVSWFEDPVVDTGTNLSLWKTLVVAFDEEEQDKLWILNV